MSVEVFEAGGEPLARIVPGVGPVICVALHAGHALRPALRPYVVLPEDERLREEDPHTAAFAPERAPLVEVVRTRFEVDLNRERDACVYRRPEDAWGLAVYRDLPESLVEESQRVHDAFYARMAALLDRACEDGRRFVVFDLHSYNHRRDGCESPPAPESANPEVNLGTKSLDRATWGGVAEAFTGAMAGRGLDVRENVKFGGGAFSRWVNARYGMRGCSLAIEFKKTFMDEWTGDVDDATVSRLAAATADAARAVTDALDAEVRP